jgi:hypothetical protein
MLKNWVNVVYHRYLMRMRICRPSLSVCMESHNSTMLVEPKIVLFLYHIEFLLFEAKCYGRRACPCIWGNYPVLGNMYLSFAPPCCVGLLSSPK